MTLHVQTSVDRADATLWPRRVNTPVWSHATSQAFHKDPASMFLFRRLLCFETDRLRRQRRRLYDFTWDDCRLCRTTARGGFHCSLASKRRRRGVGSWDRWVRRRARKTKCGNWVAERKVSISVCGFICFLWFRNCLWLWASADDLSLLKLLFVCTSGKAQGHPELYIYI